MTGSSLPASLHTFQFGSEVRKFAFCPNKISTHCHSALTTVLTTQHQDARHDQKAAAFAKQSDLCGSSSHSRRFGKSVKTPPWRCSFSLTTPFPPAASPELASPRLALTLALSKQVETWRQNPLALHLAASTCSLIQAHSRISPASSSLLQMTPGRSARTLPPQ